MQVSQRGLILARPLRPVNSWITTQFPSLPHLAVWFPLDAADATSPHDWHDFHKHNSLLIWEFGKGGDPVHKQRTRPSQEAPG